MNNRQKARTARPSASVPTRTDGVIVRMVDGEMVIYDPATTATHALDGPFGAAVGPDGTIYVADSFNHRIRAITPGGVVSTLAGTGSIGFADGPGNNAKFNFPYGVAVGPDGTIYVADTYNNRIRAVTPGGVVTTLAGTSIYVGFADGPGNTAQFNYPNGVAVGPDGTIHIADTNNHRIRAITPAGVVSTLAGTGTYYFADGPGTIALFRYPSGVAVAPNGTIYVADTYNDRIRKIT